jgi:hypothetical protein
MGPAQVIADMWLAAAAADMWLPAVVALITPDPVAVVVPDTVVATSVGRSTTAAPATTTVMALVMATMDVPAMAFPLSAG